MRSDDLCSRAAGRKVFEKCVDRQAGWKQITNRARSNEPGGKRIRRAGQRSGGHGATSLACGTVPNQNGASLTSSLPRERNTRTRTSQLIFTINPS